MPAHDNLQPQQFSPAINWSAPQTTEWGTTWTSGTANEDFDKHAPLKADIRHGDRYDLSVGRHPSDYASEDEYESSRAVHSPDDYERSFRTLPRAQFAAEGVVRRRMQGLDLKTGRKPYTPGNPNAVGKPY